MDYKIYPFKREGKIRFYVRFEDQHGKQRYEAEKEAEKAANQKVLSCFGMIHSVNKKSIDRLSDYLENYYYPHMTANRTARTLTTYKRALNHLLDLSGDHPLPFYNRSHMHDYKIPRFNNDEAQKTTINIELRGIKAAFSWAYKNDYLEHFAFKGQEYLFETKVTKREFKNQELQRLFEVTEGQMTGLAIQLAYHTWMRQGELSRAKWRMVDKRNGVVFIQLSASITKSIKPRLVPLNTEAIEILKELKAVLTTKRETIRSGTTIYPSMNVIYSRRIVGGDLYGVSKIMGHSSPQVTADFHDHSTALKYHSVVDLLVVEQNEGSEFSFLDE